ncbi:hypothetical protein AB0H83_45980 [Dactylosporangium sp. NPDC050688]|uniref:hypothetical protein n=1 Tax=Dactylosporangium sp. NPDC050688 TaxID=3157217 RepID=UPI0033E47467
MGLQIASQSPQIFFDRAKGAWEHVTQRNSIDGRNWSFHPYKVSQALAALTCRFHRASAERDIRRNKRAPNRADRHRERQVLVAATGSDVGIDAAEQAEYKLLAKKSMWVTKRWRKWRDASLAEFVAHKLQRRAEAGTADPAVVQTKIERVRRRVR